MSPWKFELGERVWLDPRGFTADGIVVGQIYMIDKSRQYVVNVVTAQGVVRNMLAEYEIFPAVKE